MEKTCSNGEAPQERPVKISQRAHPTLNFEATKQTRMTSKTLQASNPLIEVRFNNKRETRQNGVHESPKTNLNKNNKTALQNCKKNSPVAPKTF